MLRAACWVCGSRSTVGFLKSVVLCEVRDPGVWLWLVGWVSRAGGEKKGCWNDVVHVWRAFSQRQEAESVWYFLWAVLPWSGVCWHGKAGSTLRSSQAVPHPSSNRALCRLTSEVRRDPVHSTWYGRQRYLYNQLRFYNSTPNLCINGLPYQVLERLTT